MSENKSGHYDNGWCYDLVFVRDSDFIQKIRL